MKIKRNGQCFELSEFELCMAHEEYRKACRMQDIVDRITNDGDLEVSEEKAMEIAEEAVCFVEKFYDDNPVRSDLYWNALEDSIRAVTEK